MLNLVIPPPEGAAEEKSDFERLLGPANWRRLPIGTRRRFSTSPPPGQETRYIGIMNAVEATLAGRVLIRLCSLFGTPFAPICGRNVPVAIILRKGKEDGAMQWDREYRYRDHKMALVRSRKTVGSDGRLREWVDGGFGMSLDLYEEKEALHFVSRRFYWRRNSWQVALPRFLSPGEVHVVHHDLGEGRFRFVMAVVHPLFGQLFYQSGEFQPEGDAA